MATNELKEAVEVGQKILNNYTNLKKPTKRFYAMQTILHAAQLLLDAQEEVTAEQLHKWYLESITHLNGKDFNHMADRPYESLTEGQKSIDKYIADKISVIVAKLKGDFAELQGQINEGSNKYLELVIQNKKLQAENERFKKALEESMDRATEKENQANTFFVKITKLENENSALREKVEGI